MIGSVRRGAIDVCMMAPRQIETSSVCHRSKTRARSCRHRRVLTEHRGDLPPAIDPAQPDLPARHEAEEQNEGSVLAGQRALGLYAAAKFLVEPLNRVRSPYRFPLLLGEA